MRMTGRHVSNELYSGKKLEARAELETAVIICWGYICRYLPDSSSLLQVPVRRYKELCHSLAHKISES